ncbi:hypothetical protein HF086_002436 [Spodoptera exigua]|uniref:Phosphatidic acid phosphatase type 2/haloperoxidase domain-containing protein n=1 Tax=Spodoptera exigua TaxID=7107 RepID=A0A922MFR6_SPOEX|nr:hypothetical protein HF086_002436 [Spodoptera exigua]
MTSSFLMTTTSFEINSNNRSVHDSERCLGVRIPVWVRGFYSTLVCFALGTCFVEIAVNISKNVIGRPRPHFFDLYLESRMTWKGTRSLRHALQFIAVMLSWFTALSRVTDFKHHWSDVLAGYSLGTVFAVVMWVWGTDVVQKKKNNSSLPQFEIAITNQSMPPQR